MHDAFLICAPLDRLDEDVAAMRAAMAEASRIVLGGFELGTDVSITRWPDRYMDGRGRVMWQRVMGTAGSSRAAANRMTDGPLRGLEAASDHTRDDGKAGLRAAEDSKAAAAFRQGALDLDGAAGKTASATLTGLRCMCCTEHWKGSGQTFLLSNGWWRWKE